MCIYIYIKIAGEALLYPMCSRCGRCALTSICSFSWLGKYLVQVPAAFLGLLEIFGPQKKKFGVSLKSGYRKIIRKNLENQVPASNSFGEQSPVYTKLLLLLLLFPFLVELDLGATTNSPIRALLWSAQPEGLGLGSHLVQQRNYCTLW